MSDIKPVYEFNDKGKLTHFKSSHGFEQWHEYDADGNEIHFKDSNGLKEWKNYDASGNLIHFKDSLGLEYWYDSKGNVIASRKRDKFEWCN